MVHLSKNLQYGIVGALAVYVVFFTRPAPVAVVSLLSNPLAQLAVLGAIVYVGATVSLLIALVAAVAVVLSIPAREYMDNKKDTKVDAKADTTKPALDLPPTSGITALNVNDEAKHIAASSSGTATVIGTSYEWAKADYRSAKLLVKIDNGTHNEMSEILVTLDSTDNIAITEYAIVGTNGTRGTITADVSGSNVRIRVTPVNNSTIKVTGTLLK